MSKRITTKWQLAFFIALMTSWSAFEIFCSKQYNVSFLKQFIRKFFKEYTVKNVFGPGVSKSFTKKQKDIISKIDNLISKSNKSSSLIFNIGDYFDRKTFVKEIINSNILEEIEVIQSYCGCYELSITEFFKEGCKYDMSNMYFKDFFKNYLINKKKCTLFIKLTSYNSSEFLKIFKSLLTKCFVHDNKCNLIKRKHKCRFGLEFEIDRINNISMSFDEMKDIVNNNTLCLSSGFDADYDNQFKNYKNTKLSRKIDDNNRLNEDRICINSIKGLESIEKYLINANKFGALAKNSSIHLHIDDNFITKTNLTIKNTCILENYFKHIKIPILVEILNGYKYSYNKKGFLKFQNIKEIIAYYYRYNDLNTYEFRQYKPTLSYEDVVMYILISSYITTCLRNNIKINENLLYTIYKANKIVKKIN